MFFWQPRISALEFIIISPSQSLTQYVCALGVSQVMAVILGFCFPRAMFPLLIKAVLAVELDLSSVRTFANSTETKLKKKKLYVYLSLSFHFEIIGGYKIF